MVLDVIEFKNDFIKNSIVLLMFTGLLLAGVFYESKAMYAFMAFTLAFSSLKSIHALIFRKVGTFTLGEKNIQLQKISGEATIYNYEVIQCLLIDQFEYFSGFFSTKQNVVLKISIQLEEKEETFKIFLKGKKMKKEMISCLEQLYKNKVKIKEYDINGGRSFLFKSNLSYNEIQKIKQDYCLSWS